MRRLWVTAWRTGRLPVIAGFVGVLGLLWVVLVVAPPWFVQHRPLEVAKAQNDVRTTLLQVFGGVALLVGAYFTYRQLTNSREQLAHTREQLQIAQQGQITERFTRAIDQLGQPGPDRVDVRLGGIYALERIARDSPSDCAAIGEVLTAFVRGHAPWPPRLPGQDPATAAIDDVSELQVRAADVQASLTVLGRGGFAPPAEAQGDRLDLHAVDLRHADLGGVHLNRAILFGVHLEGAFLLGAHLGGVDLRDAHLGGVDLRGVHLEEAFLLGANLEGAILHGAHLEGANLHGAHLEGANIFGAHLGRAILVDAHLDRAILRDVHLEEAILRGAHLEGADLHSAHLGRADLRSAHLEGAILVGAHLEGAYFRGAYLGRTDLRGVHLEGAELRDAHLEGANLRDGHLEGADLRGAHLEGADLRYAHLEEVLVDERTSWPAGFDWRAAGVIVAGEDAAASQP